MKKAFRFLKKEAVLVISFILAAVSTGLVPIDRDYVSYIDFRTLAILFCLMTIMSGLKKLNIFRQLGEIIIGQLHTIRAISLIFIMLCFFLSMFITNDVALITFVPFTIVVFTLAGRTDMLITTIVLETVAANLGSMLLPMGNPQNIYLYSLTTMSFGEFVTLMLPYAGLSIVIIIGLNFAFVKNSNKRTPRFTTEYETTGLGNQINNGRRNNRGIHIKNAPLMDALCSAGNNTQVRAADKSKVTSYDKNNYRRTNFEKLRFWLYIALFIVSILVVVRILDFRLGFIIVFAVVLAFDIKILTEVDYSLLFTFAFLFIFIGNLKRIPEVNLALSNIVAGNEVLSSVISSQVISNVPAAILLSGFTENVELLIVGTNLGGLGTLIASMASLISFKQYSNTDDSEKGRYFLIFTLINFGMLIVLFGLYLLIGQAGFK